MTSYLVLFLLSIVLLTWFDCYAYNTNGSTLLRVHFLIPLDRWRRALIIADSSCHLFTRRVN